MPIFDAKRSKIVKRGIAMTRKAEKKDVQILADLAVLMWNGSTVNELIIEFSKTVSSCKSQFFLKYDQESVLNLWR